MGINWLPKRRAYIANGVRPGINRLQSKDQHFESVSVGFECFFEILVSSSLILLCVVSMRETIK
jgi:hypothetical protein